MKHRKAITRLPMDEARESLEESKYYCSHKDLARLISCSPHKETEEKRIDALKMSCRERFLEVSSEFRTIIFILKELGIKQHLSISDAFGIWPCLEPYQGEMRTRRTSRRNVDRSCDEPTRPILLC